MWKRKISVPKKDKSVKSSKEIYLGVKVRITPTYCKVLCSFMPLIKVSSYEESDFNVQKA